MTDEQQMIQKLFAESIAVKQRAQEQLTEGIARAGEAIVECYKKGGKLLLFGNGGSAADAQHIAGELIHQFELPRRHCLLAIALSTNSSVVTAIGNDWSFAELFERQVEGLAEAKDVVVGLTTSGNSENVVRGLKQARKKGAFTIALTGKDGGAVKEIVDEALIVPSASTARIQETHILIGHVWCSLVERSLFRESWEDFQGK